jgi:hypothetical protein
MGREADSREQSVAQHEQVGDTAPRVDLADRAHDAGPKSIEARRSKDQEGEGMLWRLHGLKLDASTDWQVQSFNANTLGAGATFTLSDGHVKAAGEEVVAISLHFFPQSLDELFEQYSVESDAFRQAFPTKAALRDGFDTDLALFDAVARVPWSAREQPAISRLRVMRWMRDRSMNVGDVVLHTPVVTAHGRFSWVAGSKPNPVSRWHANFAVFDRQGIYRGVLFTRVVGLRQDQEELFLAQCSDLVARLVFEE